MRAMTHQRYENIDALRAVAATLVLVQHFFGDVVREALDPKGPLAQLVGLSLNNVDLGRFGVVLFFLISGFVVPFSIRGTRPLKRFAISRFFRLYPALWLAVLLLSVIAALRDEAPSIATVLANMTMFPSLIGFKWLSGIYWTLTIELIFYVLCAALFWQSILYKPWVVMVFTLLLIGSTAVPILARTQFGTNLPVQYIGLHVSFLYCGLLLRLAMIEKSQGAWVCAGTIILAQFAVLFCIGDFSLARGDGFFLVGTAPIIVAYILAFAAFICAVYTGKPESPILSRGGSISYSVYLFHGAAALMTYALFPLTGGWSDLWIGLTSLVVTMFISFGVYTYLETPMISLGRKVMTLSESRAVSVI
ncbi:acyltransferase [Rhizobium sp. PL01]|uniref:acyltransferase family protein n=1 Tax=Rhizobium sp. PL01 TaxID=3085631 RepID=UPI002981C511|nr:acyltransferase [Rhizobium sp. PL01]MDW5312911.1 acyltransferase [Rhizobium sp. PL01]